MRALASKTNAVRILETSGIPHSLRNYEVNLDDLSAETVAAKIGFPVGQVFKTLVVRGERTGYLFAVIPGDREVDLKLLAIAAGDKKMDTVPLKEVQPLTGYVRGGVTALAARKEFPVYCDDTVALFDQISISAGVRGTQVLIAPRDYIRATKATIASISKVKLRTTA